MDLASEDFSRAIEAADLSHEQREWLSAHARRPEGKATMRQLSEDVGHADWQTANLLYGLIAKRIATHLPKRPKHLAGMDDRQNMGWIARHLGKGPDGESVWEMLPQLRELILLEPDVRITRPQAQSATSALVQPPIEPSLDQEALRFVAGFTNPGNRFFAHWRPRYEVTVKSIRDALRRNAPEETFELLWKTRDNAVSNAGQGVMGFDVAERLRGRLIDVIRDVAANPSPANFDAIVERFENWRDTSEIHNVPRLLIARAFAAIHPERYHTTVDGPKQDRIIPWFVRHTGFVSPEGSWASKAHALTAHLSRLKPLHGDVLTRNMFPWFVVEQMRDATGKVPFHPGHTPRPSQGVADLLARKLSIVYRHNVLQDCLYAQLSAQYGEKCVRTEHPTGTGGFADAVVRHDNGITYLYEIKVTFTAADAVREAMGQLLEYGFRKGGLDPQKLFVVAEPALDTETAAFLTRMTNEFGLNIEYLQIDCVE
jgi:hypothetical protein